MTAEQLKNAKFPVLDSGFVRLVDVMGTDASVVQAARVSYGEGTQHVSDDRKLIRYLMRHRHSTPFEMAELKFHVRVPMDCWRQWIRHRMASVNEYSTRYSEAIDTMAVTAPTAWRLQSAANKQGSAGFVAEWPTEPAMLSADGSRVEFLDGPRPYDPARTPGDYLSDQEMEFQEFAHDVYYSRLRMGVAREQARKDLPLSTYTEAYWKIDLHNLLHFLALRMDSHAQQEIRDYATVIGYKIVKELFPITWEAFEDYRLGAMTLSKLDVNYLQLAAQGDTAAQREFLSSLDKRERAELAQKLTVLGVSVLS